MIQISGLYKETYKEMLTVLDPQHDIVDILPDQFPDLVKLRIYDHVKIETLPKSNEVILYNKSGGRFMLYRFDFRSITIW